MDNKSININDWSYNIIRNSIRGIESSYSNFWDILSELLQNSVDAIKKTNYEGEIYIMFNCQNKSIVIQDNGCGIKSDEVGELLKPFSTNKVGDADTIGEKGVGLKFAYFQSGYFKIETYYENVLTTAEITGARLWKTSNENNNLECKISFENKNGIGTKVILQDVEASELFNLNINQLYYVLRTKTAVGNTDSIWKKDHKNIDIKLEYIDKDGSKIDKDVEYKYMLPIECYSNNQIIDIDDFAEWCKQEDRTDREKLKKLSDKIWVKSKVFNLAGREIYLWACYLPTRPMFGDISYKYGLLSLDELKNNYTENEWKVQNKNLLYSYGIYTAVKGMPTTIEIQNPSKGKDGYWQSMFFIIQDNKIQFDIGRKSIPHALVGYYRNFAGDVFNELTSYTSRYSLEEGLPILETLNIPQIISEINSLPDLKSKIESLMFKKIPDSQEASVCAIFYELIGLKVIKNILPVISGYRRKYDMYAFVNNELKIFEFKSHLSNLLQDLSDSRKFFSEMNYVVCWEITDDDKKKFKKEGIELDEIEEINYSGERKWLDITTHYLMIKNVPPVFVIDLKKLVCD